MPWPLLKFSKADKFEKEFKHNVKSIPAVITCDLDGNIVARSGMFPDLEKALK